MLAVFWMRRDLRLNDNAALFYALKENPQVLPVFIFDTQILSHLIDKDDARVQFIHHSLMEIKSELQRKGSDLLVLHGEAEKTVHDLILKHKVKKIYTNHDYEPQAIARDNKIASLCKAQGVEFKTYKDQCLFEKNEVLTDGQKPYGVYTPYKKKHLALLNEYYLKSYPTDLYFKSFYKTNEKSPMPALESMGFSASQILGPELKLSHKMLLDYASKRDFPALKNATSLLGVHLRFGTVSVRELAREGRKYSDVWLSELIWRDFFMQILWHHPRVVNQSYRPEYDQIAWRNNPEDFAKWCEGMTGYPLVDAGMRELNATGHMHNRVRMVVASFLCKHLLMHWSLGERYFARKLLDFDLSANNGNWQWAAGSGCDAAPYFRVFNPTAQAEKFDAGNEYIRRWVPELNTSRYPRPMVEHTFARERCLKEFSKALKGATS